MQWSSGQFISVAQSCLTLCDPMDCNTPGFHVHHQLPELAQTHIHWVDDAIQPSYPLPSPSLPTFTLSQHQGLFQWVSSSHQMAKLLELQFQHQSFQRPFRTHCLYDWLVWSPSPAPQFKSISSSPLILLYGPTLHPYMTTRKTIDLILQNFVGKVVSLFLIRCPG